MSKIAFLSTIFLSLATVLWAQDGIDISGSGRYDVNTGLPRAIYREHFRAQSAFPETQAREYLRHHALRLFGVTTLPENVLRLVGKTDLPFGKVVRFQQVFQGLPVERNEVAVTIGQSGEVIFVTSSFHPIQGMENTGTRPTKKLFREEALVRKAILREETEEIPGFPDRSESVWTQNEAGEWVEARRIEVYHPEHQHYWAVWLDAHSGSVIRKESLAVRCKHSHEPSLETHLSKTKSLPPFEPLHSPLLFIGQTYTTGQGIGKVFDPDPLTSAKKEYGAMGLLDNNDADSPELTAQLKEVALKDLSHENGQFFLRGKYAWIADTGAPFKGLFEQNSHDFSTSRSNDLFEAVNAYYHIDLNLRYVAETLGFSIPNRHAGNTTTQWFDPSALNGADNSQYDPTTGYLVFGEGGVDDAEDAGVIWHEAAHALHDRMTLGSISNATNDGLAEGFADYWAQSYLWTVQQWGPTDAPYHYVFRWDGHNPFWGGRTTQYPNKFPDGIVTSGGSLRERNGQIVASTLMEIWPVLGRTMTDQAALSAVGMTNAESNQNDYFNAFYQTLRQLRVPAGQMEQVYQIIASRGYTLPAKGLSIGLESDLSHLTVESDATLRVEINNNSALDKTNVSVTAQLPAGMVYQSNSATCPANFNNDRLVFSIGDLPAFGFKTCTFVVKLSRLTGNKYFGDDFEQGLSQWVAPKDAQNFTWTSSMIQPHQGKTSAFVQNQGLPSDLTLTLVKAVSLQAGTPVLSFWHFYNTEFFSDGGVVEISTDAGSTWQDLDTKWIMNAYNGRISSTFSTPLTARKAFTGSSQKYINSIADLSAFVNQSVLVRFRFASDAVTNGTGWYVDDVLIADQSSLDSEVCMTSGQGDQQCTKKRFMVLFSAPVESEKPALPITHEVEGIWPNPFAGTATLRLRVAKPQNVRIALHDLLGRSVGEVFEGILAAGEWRTLALDGSHMPNGVYFCRIAGETFSEVQKIVLLR